MKRQLNFNETVKVVMPAQDSAAAEVVTALTTTLPLTASTAMPPLKPHEVDGLKEMVDGAKQTTKEENKRRRLEGFVAGPKKAPKKKAKAAKKASEEEDENPLDSEEDLSDEYLDLPSESDEEGKKKKAAAKDSKGKGSKAGKAKNAGVAASDDDGDD